ncbi:GNAT family N-acetyltransferase [Oceanobacillus manasiensis]|uniref:GNAT family N-acetyltransferase n=1 Tax=Oceanobacillus manasiensis TaxID=586413 RepID=UPI0005A7D7B4|nr:GNAT family N-acetyltransferase [Oceanobacillus manasiensis]
MIRVATEADAQAIIDIKKDIILSGKTTRYFVSSPNELPMDVEREKETIRKCLKRNNLCVVFEVEGYVVGFMIFRRYEPTRLKHAGSMGMGIRNGYTNKGIGTLLLEYLTNWARKQRDVEKICLGVTSINERAIHLYRNFGFVEEGRQIKQIKYEDGSYADDILMAYYV